MTKFNISYERNGVCQTLLINAESEEIAKAYFMERKPDATVYGVHEATSSDERPGKPVIDVPADYSIETATEETKEAKEEKEGKNTMKTYAAIIKEIEKIKKSITNTAEENYYYVIEEHRAALRSGKTENRDIFIEAHRTAEAEYIKEKEKNLDIQLKIEILKDNAKQALTAELMPVIAEIWNKYEGKPHGEKTAKKISDELEAATGYYIHIGNRYDDARITIYIRGVVSDLELYPIWNGIKQPAIDSDNKIVRIIPENFKIYCCGEYVENVNKHIKELKKAHAKAKELEKAFNDAVTEYNKLTRGKIERANAREGVKNYLV